VCFASKERSIYKIKDRLSKDGWSLNALQNPPCINICITENMVNLVDEFLEDLKGAVNEVRDNCMLKKEEKNDGTDAIYSVLQQLPSAQMDTALCHYVDSSLTA
jgi:hypothetical protein